VSTTATGRVRTLPALTDNLPEELCQLPQWAVWKYIPDAVGGKPRKLPIDPKSGDAASHSDPATWSTFDEAAAAYHTGDYAGLMFALTAGDPYVFIDLDGCRNAETGEIKSWAREIIDRFDSYTEASPSGTGVHILIKGKLPPGRRRRDDLGIEVYEEKRFACLTGHLIEGRS
jgi:putative DNA primase/helicase